MLAHHLHRVRRVDLAVTLDLNRQYLLSDLLVPVRPEVLAVPVVLVHLACHLHLVSHLSPAVPLVPPVRVVPVHLAVPAAPQHL